MSKSSHSDAVLDVLRDVLELAIAEARGRSESPPVALKPFLHFQRLNDRALSAAKRAVDADDEFRAAVAAKVGKGDVNRGSWLWLRRPEGWEDEYAELVAARADEVDRRDVAGDLRQAQRRTKKAEVALSKAERRSSQLERRLERIEAAHAERGVRVQELEERLSETEERAAGSERERSRAVSDLKRAEQRYRNAVADLKELEQAGTTPSEGDATSGDVVEGGVAGDGTARGPVASAPAAAVDPEQVELGHSALGAMRSSLAEVLDRVDELSSVVAHLDDLERWASESPGDVGGSASVDLGTGSRSHARSEDDRSGGGSSRRGGSGLGRSAGGRSGGGGRLGSGRSEGGRSGRGRGGRPADRADSEGEASLQRARLRLPVPLVDGTQEAARWLLRQPATMLLVDGYNVSMLRWPERDITGQRASLMRSLDQLCARFGAETVAVFDSPDAGVGVGRPPGLCAVEFSAGREADDVIIERSHSLARVRPVVVASNDRRVADGARAANAHVIPATILIQLFDS